MNTTTKFEDRLLAEIQFDYHRLASAPPVAAPTRAVAPQPRYRRGMRSAIVAGSVAAALVLGGVSVGAIINSGAPQEGTAAPHVSAPQISLASAVTAINAAGPVQTATTQTSAGSITSMTNSDAGITTTTYTDAGGTVTKKVGFRNAAGAAGQLEAIQVNFRTQTWSQGEFGGDPIANPATELKAQLTEDQNGGSNGTATVTGNTVLDGENATVVTLAAPDGSDASTLYLDSTTSLPIKLVGPDGTATTYTWVAATAENGPAAWPTAPAGFTETTFSEVDLK